jgi:hypothetical protein
MPLRNRECGKAAQCEYGTCQRMRGAPNHSVYIYGCVLCTMHEDEYQKGKISLPQSAEQKRKDAMAEKILG